MALSRSNLITFGFLADAATMPLHWIYNQADIEAKVADGTSAIFYPTPSCPFYNYPKGVLSPYGDESLPLLRSIAREHRFEFEKVCEEYHSFFSVYGSEEGKGYAGR